MKTKRYLKNLELIQNLSNGVLKSREIGDLIGESAKYVQDVWKKNPDILRPRQAPPVGECNPSYVSGKIVDLDGYVLIPSSDPSRKRIDRIHGRSLEHRVVVENQLGRRLERLEVVHHKNSCKIDNRPENLELCSSNGEHLKMELSGKTPRWTKEGASNFGLYWRKDHEHIDTYRLLRKSGVIRAQQILLAESLLGKEYLSLYKMERYLKPSMVFLCNEISKRMASGFQLSFYDLEMLIKEFLH